MSTRASGSSAHHESAAAQVAGTATYIDDMAEARGTLYAAIALLEALGCRFWAPNATSFPAAPVAALPPRFPARCCRCASCRGAAANDGHTDCTKFFDDIGSFENDVDFEVEPCNDVSGRVRWGK